MECLTFLILFSNGILPTFGNRFVEIPQSPSTPWPPPPSKKWEIPRQSPRFPHPPDRNLENDVNPYRHEVTLDPQGKFKVEWLVDWERSQVHFNLTVETHGYVGFGLSKDGRMHGADLVIGGVDGKSGVAYFTDRHLPFGATSRMPVIDKKQDWVLHSAWESDYHTHLSFSRPFDTCDPEDIRIGDDALYLMWAWGESDHIEYHRGNRGAVPRYLLDPDLTPRLVHERLLKENTEQEDRALLQNGIKVWSLKNRFKIPPKRTTYWCQIHRLRLEAKHHMIGLSFKINNETRSNMHHMLLYRCIAPNAAQLLDRFVGHPGEECYSQGSHRGQIPLQSCVELKSGHAIGGLPVFFPEEVGFPLGHTSRTEYYLLQAHYDNPEGRSDLVSINQMDIYYTAKLRPRDGGVMSIGQHIPGSPSILLPPYSIDHRIYGHCSVNCTKKMLPREGIKIFGNLLHTHNAGRRIAFQHFRNGKELAKIANDDNYQFLFQPVRIRREEANILPGDQTTMRCFYSTTNTNKTLVGGYGTDQEMCKTFALYYNLLEDYPICRSELISPTYNARYLAGAMNLTWDQTRLEYMATAPPHLAGLTVSQISDSPYVNWIMEQRARLQRDHIVHPQVEICPSNREVAEARRTGILPVPTFTTHPIEGEVPPAGDSRCSLA